LAAFKVMGLPTYVILAPPAPAPGPAGIVPPPP